MKRLALVLAASLSLPLAAGCHRRAPKAAAVASGPKAPPGTHFETWPGLGRIVVPDKPKTLRAADDQRFDDSDDADNTNKRFHMATVYVDGQPRVAFTYNEMPPGVRPIRYQWDKGQYTTHFLICDYFKTLGVDCNDIQATHWYGGRDRVVVISGKDLRKYRNKFYFNFSRELFGKPRVEWRNGVHTNDTVDIVTDLAIYVHKKPPRWDREQWALLDDNGKPIPENIPYSTGELNRRAVRINLDGRLVAQLKRNLLDGNLTPVNAGKSEDPRYRLEDFLKANKIPTASFRGVDLVTRDERVIRLGKEDYQGGVEFSAPRHSHGEVVVYAGGHALRASVINLYERLDPPTRQMRTVTLGPSARRAGSFTPAPRAKNPGFSRPASP